MHSLLRHTLATLSYRLGKVLRDAPDSFATFPEGEPQNAGKILAHIGDLMDWALTMVEGQSRWNSSQPLPWPHEVARFYASIAALDARLAESGSSTSGGDAFNAERLFQGPIADALTHVGQLAMMRRQAGIRVSGENYYLAEIVAGRVGPDQAAPRRVF
jgi:hypothetical protein